MFNVGDKIVYPMHGAGTIDSIEEKNILGENQFYYVIRMPGEVKVMVPTDRAEQIGVRNVIGKEEAEKVISILGEDETEMSQNWNKRYRDNMEKMKSGSVYEVADVVGKNPDEAKKLLEHFLVEYSGRGDKIISQSPSAGTRLEDGSTIKLMLGN